MVVYDDLSCFLGGLWWSMVYGWYMVVSGVVYDGLW